ncbi:MAG: hypothetical protein JSU85_11140 [Candidatus Zixiibacteriota bacterium]|nr:MAG: hypothetical protein JSU85_11140 [candidate division Zixibacteria bacterium]
MIVLGNKELLGNELAAVLNSSQSKTPCGDDSWVKGSIAAVKNLIELGYTIVTSLYLNTWEIPVYLVSEYGGSQIIVSPVSGEDLGYNIYYKTVDQFKLDRNKTAMVFIKSEADSKKPKSTWFNRDLAVAQIADLLVPVSIRPRGKLEKLLSETNKEIESKFRIDYAKPLIKPPKYDFGKTVSPEGDWDYITHWTRTHHGPWPGESKYDFYRRMVNSESEYPNNAFNSLKNMIQTKKIYASSERIRKSIRCIGFSDLKPESMLKWMRWLPKRVGWNFEPYGIAIKKEAADKAGMRQVIYGDDELYEKLPENDRPYFQSKGKKDVDWSQESEWRKIGDLNIKYMPEKELALMVWRKTEAQELSKITDIKSIFLYSG